MTSNRKRTTGGWSILAAAVALTIVPVAGHAQTAPHTTTGQDAKQVVTQPARDVGIEKTRVPPLLAEIGDDPYSMRDTGNCRQISAAIGALNGVLGGDFTGAAPPKRRNIAKAGGAAVVNSLIPFRGLVREVSGAGPAERRLDAAVQAGFARRGFLRGLQRARGCR